MDASRSNLQPDFWLVECDTYWRDVPDAVACFILDGPGPLLEFEQFKEPQQYWLVRVEPPVTDHGITTDHVLVVHRAPNWSEDGDWSEYCVGAYSVHPAACDDRTRFRRGDVITSHKITVTTRPDQPYQPSGMRPNVD